MATEPIRYRIVPRSPEAHRFEASVTVADPDPGGQRFALPAWIPGSYLVRDFARHVVAIDARSGRRPVRLTKIDKHTWRAARCDGPLTVTAEVHAWDLSVRGAHLDTTHGFFNGPCVFLRVIGAESRPCEVEIMRPRGARYREWRVATAMRRRGASRHGFGIYAATDYDELIDHPVEMGTFTLGTFVARGVPHEIAITGGREVDMARLCRDLRRLCAQHIGFWGAPAPMDRYLFLVTAVGDGYGGLEHRASTALLCSREDLPRAGEKTGEHYRTFLGLASHEYFHTWNVKRIKPAAFAPYDLERENYTGLLWAFEGVTSYYDDLALVRCGLIRERDYLEVLGRTATALLRNPGRSRQTVAESSWDAWIKCYRPDENTPNAVVSYYGKGSLVALCLDLLIRARTRGRKSLDDVMRALWACYGRTGTGVPEDGVERAAAEVSGLRLRGFFDRALRSTAELPLARLLGTVGLKLAVRPADSPTDRGGRRASMSERELARQVTIGARVANDGTEVKLNSVLDGGAAQRAGLASGDVIVALGGLRATPENWTSLLACYRPGDTVEAVAFRRDELMRFAITLEARARDTCVIAAAEAAPATAIRRRRAWLGRPTRRA
jgi:predicted metalloprotease with PDZ domain